MTSPSLPLGTRGLSPSSHSHYVFHWNLGTLCPVFSQLSPNCLPIVSLLSPNCVQLSSTCLHLSPICLPIVSHCVSIVSPLPIVPLLSKSLPLVCVFIVSRLCFNCLPLGSHLSLTCIPVPNSRKLFGFNF